MEPENPTPVTESLHQAESDDAAAMDGAARETPNGGVRWIFLGPQGLRAGWSAAIFIVVFIGIPRLLFWLAMEAAKQAGKTAPGNPKGGSLATVGPMAFGEGIGVVFLVGMMALMAWMERRHMLDYYLRDRRVVAHGLAGLACGFAALSALMGVLSLGGWAHFTGVTLGVGALIGYAAAWGGMFVLVGCMEEGMFRCYLQFTFARGINFWWAAGVVACICAELLWRGKGNGVWGVYGLAMAGVLPCLWLYLRRSPGNGFWQAAWATSTLFGFVHTGNNGENWIGIFAAGAIGFVFCASIYVTGSAWWAIGCHAAWDWAETYFYGTADSGMVAKGHLLTTAPAGSMFWSGGADGPEGSILVIPIILLLLVALLVIYRRRAVLRAVQTPEQVAG